MASELVAASIEAYGAELERMARESQQLGAGLRRERATVERKIERMLKAIEDGMYTSSMKTRMQELEARRDGLNRQLTVAAPPTPVLLHPRLSDVYKAKVADLQHVLDDDGVRSGTAVILRSLIDHIVLTPGQDGLQAELHGDLAAILTLCDDTKSKHPRSANQGCRLSVVAGA